MENEKMIENDEYVSEFYDFVQDDKEYKSSYYLTYLVRPKYLTEEERKRITLKSQSLDVKMYSNYSELYRSINEILLNRQYYRYKWNSIPKIAQVLYAGLNPIDFVEATKAFKTELLNKEMRGIKEEGIDIVQVYSNIPKLFLKQCTIYKSKKNIVDIDVDIDEEDLSFKKLVFKLLSKLTKEQIGVIRIVETQGGFHFLSKMTGFNREWNPMIIVALLKEIFPEASEVKINEQGLIPLPGTLQNNKLVTIKRIGDL